jgi:hypothetical protein
MHELQYVLPSSQVTPMQYCGQIPHLAIAGVEVAVSSVNPPAITAKTENATKQAAESFFMGFLQRLEAGARCYPRRSRQTSRLGPGRSRG